MALIGGLFTLPLLDFNPPWGASFTVAAATLVAWLFYLTDRGKPWSWLAVLLLGATLALGLRCLPGVDATWFALVPVAVGAAVLFGFARWQPAVALLAAAAVWVGWMFLHLTHGEGTRNQVALWALLVGAVLWVAAYADTRLGMVGWLAAGLP